MAYPNFEKVEEMTRLIRLHADLKTEHGAEGVAELLAETRRVLRSTLTRMKQLPADGRLAHLLSEIWERLRLVGLGDAQGFDFPMTQIDLADACGTTAIHMNRMVQKLRAGGIVDIRRGRVNVLDRAQLHAIARYDPDYLYGPGDLAVGAHFDIAD